MDLSSQPEFRRKVLETLFRRVPSGSVVSYADLAHMVGSPRAARAVGGAMAGNPLPIFIPCHRVVGRKGLGGFGPGLACKEWLLRLEGAWSADGVHRGRIDPAEALHP
jgi:methylated-DNA-[protein]-cysteine S-methyltransferase